MKIRYIGILLLLIAAGSFLAGYLVKYNSSGHNPAEAHRILYYVDPMNPAFKSDKPGTAPCGMPLEPVYADQSASGGADLRASMPPGAFRISAEKQQLIGVKVMTVDKAPWTHTLRVLGRVTPDETRTFRLNAAVSGWIVGASPFTTGSMVRESTVLATYSFYSTEFRTALQAYVNILSAANLSDQKELSSLNIQTERAQRVREYENIRVTGRGTTSWPLTDAYKQNLLSYGITESQLEEIGRTRKFPEVVEIRAPISGFILARNVAPNLRFDRGAEFYRIADLSRVWILADVFENESSFFKPGMPVKVELPYQKKTLYARMSHVLPQFDPSTRTLKVRLEAENPGYAMRPDMLVNVDIPTSGPSAILVPVEAVLDSGLNKTVFVDRGSGFFEPRQVETGRSLGERVEITRGLMPGEKIVVSGNFLIDSEARMQKVAAGITGKIARDPVCGMNIDEDQSRAAGNLGEYRGKTYFFCTSECRDAFIKDPEQYLKSSLPTRLQGAPKHQHAAHDATMEHTSHEHTKAVKKSHSTHMPVSHDHTTTPMTGDMKAMPPAKGCLTTPTPNASMQMPGSQGPAAMPGAGGSVMTSGPQGPKPMAEGKTMDMFPPSKGAPPQQMPGAGGSMMTSGPQGPAPMPGARTGDVFSPALPGTDIKSTPQMPMPGTTPTQAPALQPAPGSQGGTILTEPAYQKRIRSFGRPIRIRGAPPPDITTTPGSQDNPAAPSPNSYQMITPGGGSSPAGQMKKDTSNSEKVHD